MEFTRFSKMPPPMNCIVERKRGFRPSDLYDPTKRKILLELSTQLWQRKKEPPKPAKTVDLRKIFTPATDAPEIVPKNRKLYASSAFYSPTLHPTVEDQVELARRISHSLSDISNQKSKGQSMYVNRKKRSVKWVHEGCAQDYQPYQPKPATSPSIVPAYSDAGKHRVQLNIHQDQLIEKYSKPGLQVVKSPWEAALQTGSASTAFLEESKYRSQTPIASAPSPLYFNRDVVSREDVPLSEAASRVQEPYRQSYAAPPAPVNPQRELAYKPSVAQGWGGRNVELPKGLYVPKEISLASYAPPPKQHQPQPQQHPYTAQGFGHTDNSCGTGYAAEYEGSTAFPLSKPTSGFSTSVPPRQQLYAPSSYQKVQPTTVQAAPQVNFNPSPLSFDKLSKFEQPEQRHSSQRYLNVRNTSHVRNVSPTPFGFATSQVDNLARSPISMPSISPQSNYGPPAAAQALPSHNQTFNNCARGWGSSSRVPLAAAGSLPYSDF